MITNNVLNYNTQTDNFVMDDKRNEFYYDGKQKPHEKISKEFRDYAKQVYMANANFDGESHTFNYDNLHYSEQLELLGKFINYADYDIDSVNEFMQQRLHLLLNRKLSPQRMINFMKAFISFIRKDLSLEIHDAMNDIAYYDVSLSDLREYHHDLAQDY